MPDRKKLQYKKHDPVWSPSDRSIYNFTFDYFKSQEYNWWHVLHKWYMNYHRPYKVKPKAGVRILEIGSFEGSSSVWFIEEMVARYGCELHCVDRWLDINPVEDMVPGSATSKKAQSRGATMVRAEDRFEENINIAKAKYLKKKDYKLVKTWKGDSTSQLCKIHQTHGDRSFDIIYVDGSHEQNQVMIDALLSYKLLDYGGLIVFDDYQNSVFPEGSVRVAVDNFFAMNRHMLSPMYKLASKDRDHPMYDGAPDDDGLTRNKTRYLDASQAWFRKLKHEPSKNRRKIPEYDNN